jgi:hypothetical protein
MLPFYNRQTMPFFNGILLSLRPELDGQDVEESSREDSLR